MKGKVVIFAVEESYYIGMGGDGKMYKIQGKPANNATIGDQVKLPSNRGRRLKLLALAASLVLVVSATSLFFPKPDAGYLNLCMMRIFGSMRLGHIMMTPRSCWKTWKSPWGQIYILL